VGALCYCMGIHEAAWPSERLEVMGDSVGKEHPEWVLGLEQAPRWCSTSWNLAVPEVKQHILQLVTETCRQADWDGVELDWQRHAFHLPAADAYRPLYPHRSDAGDPRRHRCDRRRERATLLRCCTSGDHLRILSPQRLRRRDLGATVCATSSSPVAIRAPTRGRKWSASSSCANPTASPSTTVSTPTAGSRRGDCVRTASDGWIGFEVLPTTVWPAALTGSTSSTGTAAVTRIVPC